MTKIALAIVACSLALLATPASAQHYGHGHHSHHAHRSHHVYVKPVHHGYHHQRHVQPTYHAHQHVHAYKPVHVVYKAPAQCFEYFKSYGGHLFKKPVECKVEHVKPVKIVEKLVEAQPAPAPIEEVPQK